MAVEIQGLEAIIRQGPLSDDEWARVRRDEARALDAQIRRNPHAVPADFVNGNFRDSWRRGDLPISARFGTDYDYWGAVVADAFALWNRFAAGLQPGYHDYIAEGKHRWAKHASLDQYQRAGFSVWENGRQRAPGSAFKGPVIDCGPNADFAIFLEQPKAHFRVFRGVGLVRTLADTLASRWDGIHSVYFATAKHGDTIYPFARIRNRHAR